MSLFLEKICPIVRLLHISIFVDIRVFLNANNRTETDVSDEPLFLRKSAQFLRKLEYAPFYRKITQRVEQIIFMDIRVLLNANNRTETDFADEPLFWRKSAQLSVYCTFLFKEIGICTILSENHKDVEQIIFMDIRVLLNANNRTKTDVSDDSLYF